MPGQNDCIIRCGSCRRMEGVEVFKLPSEDVDKEWRSIWLGEIKKRSDS